MRVCVSGVMCIFMCVFAYVCVCVIVIVRVRLCAFASVLEFMPLSGDVRVCVWVRVCVRACVRVFVSTYVCVLRIVCMHVFFPS